jgi:hypothetical protein
MWGAWMVQNVPTVELMCFGQGSWLCCRSCLAPPCQVAHSLHTCDPFLYQDEARKMWGGVLNHSRNIMQQVRVSTWVWQPLAAG